MSPTISTDGPWSIGVLIGGPVTIALLLLGLGAIVAGIVLRDDGGWGVVGGGAGWIAVVLAFALSPIGFYPYGAEYHQWRNVSGTVEKIDSRLISVGKSMEDKFVVRFVGSGLQFGCDDTRCSQVGEGDALTLSCQRAWQYTGTDGYDCRFVSMKVTS